MKYLFLIILSLSLGSCITFHSTPVIINTTRIECNPFDSFHNTEPPKVRELTEAELKNRASVEQALLEIIVEQKRFAQIKHREIEEVYNRYLKECK